MEWDGGGLGQQAEGGEGKVKRRAPARKAACSELNFEQAFPAFIPSGLQEKV